MKQVIAATTNAGKLREFSRIFAPHGIEVLGQDRLLPDLKVEETGTTFKENAFLKAQAVYRLTGHACVADDSGLCVDALDGAPGVYSARYAGEQTPYAEKIGILLQELKDVPEDKRSARFVAHICYVDGNGRRHDFEETCEGMIGYAPAGENGFGYDPIFYVGEQSFAQISDAQKDAISHRGKALQKLAAYLEDKIKNEG